MRSKLLIGGLGAAVAFLLATSPVVAQAAGFITSGDIKNSTIKSKDVKDNNLKGADVKTGSLNGSDVADGSLGTADLADSAVNSAKLANGGVAAADLAAGAQPRLASTTAIASMGPSTTDVNIADVALTTGGVPGTNQLVRVNVLMQLDHDANMGSSCAALWRLTRDASATVLGTWGQDFTNGAIAEEHNVAISFITTQASGTTSTYHILGSNSCTQTLFTDRDLVTAEAFPLSGSGAAPARAGAVSASEGDGR